MLKYVRIYHDFLTSIEPLNYEERGRLLTAILQYSSTGELPVLEGNERFTFPEIKKQIDREQENYEAVSAARSDAGKKGGRSKTKESKRKQKKQMLSEESKKSNCLQDKDKDKYKYEDKYEDNNIAPTALEIALGEFRQYRKEMHKPLTPLAETKLMNQLQTLSNGDEAVMVQIIDQSIRNGWQGVFPLKDQWHKQAVVNYAQHERAAEDWAALEKKLFVNLDEV